MNFTERRKRVSSKVRAYLEEVYALKDGGWGFKLGFGALLLVLLPVFLLELVLLLVFGRNLHFVVNEDSPQSAEPGGAVNRNEAKPKLKQFAELTAQDFESYPVWIGCHTADYDQRWYEDTDEETFRPRKGALPADPAEGMLLVRATAVLADGSEFPAVVTPACDKQDLGTLQPLLFVNGRMFSFWGGMPGVPQESRTALYDALGRCADKVFPIRVSAAEGLTLGVTAASVEGFYRMGGNGAQVDH